MIVMRHGRKVRDSPVEGDIDEFRERVVAYMIGARDDFAEQSSWLIRVERLNMTFIKDVLKDHTTEYP